MTPRERYHADVARGVLRADAAQVRALESLQDLYEVLIRATNAPRGLWSRLIGAPRCVVRGLYLWGGPGRGKSYLMDSFFECLPFPQKRRVHFHPFMQEVHAHLQSLPHTPNPLQVIGRRMAEQWRVLCLDEFHVHDIADAMLLAGLLRALFEAGITLVATSNTVPDELYLDGLQRDRFLPAIDLLKMHTGVLHLDSPIDFRCDLLDRGGTYHIVDSVEGNAILKRDFHRLAPVGAAYEQVLILHQRAVPVVAIADDVVWFRFADVCEAPLWARDYLWIARGYHTVFISDIPYLDESKDDAAKRFMHLIDAFYDHNVKLVVSARAAPQDLYSGRYLRYAFARTVSRLVEMGSYRYLAKPHR